MIISGLSNICLYTTIGDLIEPTIVFYSSLGFKVIYRNDKRADLHLFSNIASPVTLSIQLVNPDKSSSIQDSTSSSSLENVKNLKKYDSQNLKTKRRKSNIPVEISNPIVPILLTFFSTNLDELEIHLKKNGIPVKSELKHRDSFTPIGNGSFGSSNETYLSFRDPLNNEIQVSDSQGNLYEPFQKQAYTDHDNTIRSVTKKSSHTDSETEVVKTLSSCSDKFGSKTQIHLLKNEQFLDSTSSLVNCPKRNIGILTSGGDSSGMNAAVRAITRYSLQRECQPFAIFEGYNGLVEGGDKIKQLGWEDVRGLLSMGGTVIGTARSTSFRTKEGRLKAAKNMIQAGLDSLIVIGGDGSLTGADTLRSEWPTLVQELIKKGEIKEQDCSESQKHLTIVGLVGSIDNDMSSTDITIGAVTSLHRICESLDSLTSTALSHQRAFVVEVMGRHCGWLALMAAIAVGADWVFLPERPPPLDFKYGDDWESEMCAKLQTQKAMGSRALLIIVAEGAIDKHLQPIKAEYIKSVIDKNLGLDTRVTTLGHVQRGGTPCAYDRFLASIQGVEAVEAVLRSTPDTPSPMIGLSQNKITNVPLMEAVKLTHAVGEAISKKDFKRAMELRDPDFTDAYNAYIESALLSSGPGERKVNQEEQLRIGIIHIGAPAGGMNAATRIAARLCLNRGHVPIGIKNGFSGLVRDEVSVLAWQDVTKWQTKGASELGTNRDHPLPGANGPKLESHILNTVELGAIAYHLQKNNIQALMIIGGFEGFTSLLTLHRARSYYPAFCIPMVHLPATISNNVPGTEYSVGSDTALNVIVEACDRIKLSANASRSRVFVVEVQGGECGYLAVMGGLTCGATTTYIPEKGINIDMIQKDIKHLINRYEEERCLKIPPEGRIILRTETAGQGAYSTNVISNILKCEGKGLFDSRTTILGHLQQGGIPSPLDRIRATRLAVHCVDWLQKTALHARQTRNSPCELTNTVHMPDVYTTEKQSACVIGIRGAQLEFTSVEDLYAESDVKKRRGSGAWWLDITKLINILAKYEFMSEHRS